MRTGCPHHIDMFHSNFTHSWTSAAFILSKSIIRATLVVSCRKGVALSEACFYIFWMVYVVSLSVQVCDHSKFLSIFTSVPLIPRSTKFYSFPSNLTLSSLHEL